MKKHFLFFILLINAFTCFSQINPSKNIISIDVNQPQDSNYTYDSAFRFCESIGMKETGLFLTWTSIETAPETFNFTYADIANEYYPLYNTPIDLTIAPIATDVLEVPSDLRKLNFDDSTMIHRFDVMLDSLFKHIPNLQLASLVIGSEVDIYLGSDSAKWYQYINFFKAVSTHARTLRPNIKIACEATYAGLTEADSVYMRKINNLTDHIGVSYYPLSSTYQVLPPDTVKYNFLKIVSLYPTRLIDFYQLGYPSSSSCSSSLTKQADFIKNVFSAWDSFATSIRMIDFTWLHDISPATVTAYSKYYGVSDTSFLAYLGTLGLITYTGYGAFKPAFHELICEAAQRAYNTVLCLTSLPEISERLQSKIEVVPMPINASSKIILSLDKSENIQLAVYNMQGQMLYIIDNSFKDAGVYIYPLDHLAATGMYFIKLVEENSGITVKKVIKCGN
jgi:hypothetical protein